MWKHSRWPQRLAPRAWATALIEGLRRGPRRRTYPLLGLVLAHGAPGGLALTRALEQGTLPRGAWLTAELAADPAGYLFLALFTGAVFVLLGLALGSQEDRLRRLAVTDSLTGLCNRRYFDERLADEAARASRYGLPVTLLLLDLDGLKEINDQGGHHAGDRAIRAVAATLCQTVRATDTVARYAGDEFTVLLPHTDLAAGLGVAQRINRAVRALLVAPGGAPLTVSIGVADLACVAGADPAALIAAADVALYQAKAGGRDTVRAASPAAVLASAS